MAIKYNTITSLLKATCDAIRGKEQTTENIKHQDIPSRIAAILTPSDGTIQTKTSSDLTAEGKTVIVPSGYYAEQYTKDVNKGALKPPSIEVNTQTGVITANSLVRTSGYIESTETQPDTKQLVTYDGGTWTPSSTNGYSLSAGTYLTNTLRLNPDSNFKKENIKNGVSIYGVTGNYKGEEVKGIWEVVNAGTTYGFTKTSDGYYTSNNQGKANTAAVCKINLQIFEYTTITFSCINNAESIYDYGMIGQPNVILDGSSTDTEYSNTSKILKHFRDQQSSSVQPYSISFDKGSYFLYIKYRKDSSRDVEADSFKFTISSGAIEGKTGIIPSVTVDYKTTYLDPGNGIEFEAGTYMPNGYNVIANDSGGGSGSGGYGSISKASAATDYRITFNLDTTNMIGFVMWNVGKLYLESDIKSVTMLMYVNKTNSNLTDLSSIELIEVNYVDADNLMAKNSTVDDGEEIDITITSSSIQFKFSSSYDYRLYSGVTYWCVPIYSVVP